MDWWYLSVVLFPCPLLKISYQALTSDLWETKSPQKECCVGRGGLGVLRMLKCLCPQLSCTAWQDEKLILV